MRPGPPLPAGQQLAGASVPVDATENRVPAAGDWVRRFFSDVMWSWAGVGVGFFTAFFLSPYIIRKLGDQRYGVWALAFSFVDYFILFDFGFKAASVNFASRARVEGNIQRINTIVNTTFFYFLVVATILTSVTVAFAGELHRFFQIAPELRGDFTMLVRLIAVGWGSAIALGVFNAMVEAFHLFRQQTMLMTGCMVLRSCSWAVLLYFGFGLTEMAAVVLVSQCLLFAALGLVFWRAFPALRISPRLADRGMWKEMAGYGVHSFVAGLGSILLVQGPPVLVGHFRPEAFVGYYTLPSRLLQNIIDAVTRIGYVTVPNTTQLYERGERASIVKLGIYLNRYCFVLFAPLAVFLLLYGRELIGVWVGPGFAERAAPLLPPFVIMTGLAVAGQFNSSQILFGLARHREYSRLLLAEAILSLVVMAMILPKYGILGAAWVACIFAVVNRGLTAPVLLSRILEFPVIHYLRGIYLLAACSLVPLFFYAGWLRRLGLAGSDWRQLLLILGLLAAPYYTACFFTLVEADHRRRIFGWVRARLDGGVSA